MIYQAGSSIMLPHRVTVGLGQADDPNRHSLIARWIEFWCDVHCEHPWSLIEDDFSIIVGFQSECDAAMFKLSPEYELT